MGVSHFIKLVISDCHLGSGALQSDGTINPLEDFRKDDLFVEFLEFHSKHPYVPEQVELIINGDFFDMLQVRTNSHTPYEIIESIAVHKIRRILRGHPKVVKAIRDFLNRGSKVKMIWGNHDAGLWWPLVRHEITNVISPKIEFMFQPYEFDSVRIEHGHQYEIMHHFDVNQMFIEVKGRRVLNYPFGSFFVAGFLSRIKFKRAYISQVVPFSKFIRWAFIFDFWFALIQGVKSIWFFFLMRFIYHPYRFTRISKTFAILFEIMNRPKFGSIAPDILKKNNAKILVMGHDHQPIHRYYSDGTQYVNTGTWTDVTSFNLSSLGRLSRPTYAVLEYPENVKPGEGVVPQIGLRIWRGSHKEYQEFEP